MKYDNLIKISLVVVMGVVLLGLGIRFYGNGVADLNREATRAFEEALKRELATKNVTVDSLRVRSQVDASTIGQTPNMVRIIRETGEEWYQVSTEKHQRNVVEDTETRMFHSFALKKSPIVPDSLNVIWQETLKELSITGKTGLRIAITDGCGNVASLITTDCHHFASTFCLVYCTLGYACEIEIFGFVHCPWWFVLCRYVMFYILLLSVVCVLVYIFVSHLMRRLHRPSTIEIKEVIVTHTQLVKDIPRGEPRVYKLTEKTCFDAANMALIIDGEMRERMPLQCCTFLEMFLNASEYKLSDDVIMERLWPDHTGSSNRLYQVVGRLREVLRVDPSIHLERVHSCRYQLFV